MGEQSQKARLIGMMIGSAAVIVALVFRLIR
jgi:hypothetical protein